MNLKLLKLAAKQVSMWSLAVTGSLLLACSTKQMSGSEFERSKVEYEKLKSEWRNEVLLLRLGTSSDTHDYWTIPSAQRMLGMGKRALPFVMHEIAGGDFVFNVAADKITGIQMGSKTASEQERARLWADWWADKQRDPNWNPYAAEGIK